MRFTIFTFSLLLLVSCSKLNDKQEANQKTFDVPTLLDRSEKITYNKEWDAVQNTYSSARIILNSNSEDINSLQSLAELFIAEARVTGEHGHYYPAALSCLQQILTVPKLEINNKFIALRTKATVLLSLHEFDQALEVAQQALAINQTNSGIYGVLVDCYVELGDYEAAITAADKMISIRPDLRSYSRVSYLKEIHGDVEGSIDALVLAIQSSIPGEERRAWALLHLGQLYHKYGQSDLAISVFEQCVKERENYSFAIDAIGQVLLDQNKLTEAYTQFKKASEVIPEVGYFINMANVYKATNQPEAFEKMISEIMVMLKEDTDSGHNMNLEYADIYLNLLGDTDKALEYANYEFEKRPDNIDVNTILTEIHLNQRNIFSAKQHLAKATATGSKDPALEKLQQLINNRTTS